MSRESHHARQKNQVATTTAWSSECVFTNTKSYYEALCQDVAKAHSRVDAELYLLEAGKLSTQVFQCLHQLLQRGGRVRLIVDGIGSGVFVERHLSLLAEQGFEVRVYNPSPLRIGFLSPRRLLYFLTRINRRDHKKLFIIDGRIAYAGSMNLHDNSLIWRETGVRVEGEGVKTLEDSFLWSWRQGFNQKRKSKLLPPKQKVKSNDLVKLNHSLGYRRARHQEMYQRMALAERTIWLATPYFVPPPKLVRRLGQAASRGVDVRLLLPRRSDHKVMNWVGMTFFKPLLECGVRIYFYETSFLHQKILMIDDWAVVGSTNMNHRSLVRDLELDIQLTHKESLLRLKESFRQDLQQSSEVSLADLQQMSLWAWLAARLALLLKSWI